MSGIFDRLQKKMEVESQGEGISPLDLAALPPLLRKIMRYLLREYELLYSEICEWAASLPDDERPSQVELDQALDVLSRQFWLIKRGEGARVRYQTNLRRKAGSKLADGVWSALDTKIAAIHSEKKESPPE
jgi:hypothetical protein